MMDTLNSTDAPPSFVPNIAAMHVYPSVSFLFKKGPIQDPKRSGWRFLRG